MSTQALTHLAAQPATFATQRPQADLALRRVLDAEIEALTARLAQWSANAPLGARADLDRRHGWLRDSVAKLQARRDALS